MTKDNALDHSLRPEFHRAISYPPGQHLEEERSQVGQRLLLQLLEQEYDQEPGLGAISSSQEQESQVRV